MGVTRILVVEDDADVADLVRHTLERSGDLEVSLASSGTQAIRLVGEAPPDLIVLDLNLRGIDGLEVCRLVRATPATAAIPIIMLTARTEEADQVLGLDMGADDYITKPFSPRELAARVRAVMRRRLPAGAAWISLYRGAHLAADFDAISISVDGHPVRLTRREFDLLRCLVENRNRVLTREWLLARVWRQDEATETRSVDVHIGRLRSKLGAAAAQVETVVGIGYRFVE